MNGRSAGRSDDRSLRSMMSIVSSNVKGCSSDPRAAADTIIEELVSVFSHRFPRLFSLHVATRDFCSADRLRIDQTLRIGGWACHFFFFSSRTASADQSTIDQLPTVVALRGSGRAKRSAGRHPHSMDRFRPDQRSS